MKKILEMIRNKRMIKCIDTRTGESFMPVEYREVKEKVAVENYSAHRFY